MSKNGSVCIYPDSVDAKTIRIGTAKLINDKWVAEPLPNSNGRIPFFGGYDAANDTSNNTSWIYKGVIKDGTSVEDLSGREEIGVYPNPPSEYIEINLERWSPSTRWTPSEIKIYNIFGECVIIETIHPMTLSHRMNIENLPVGLYFINFGNYSEKFMVLR